MGNRLSAIVTRTGDGGLTSLNGQSRCTKYHPAIALLGELDEFNSLLGVAINACAQSLPKHHPKLHHDIQIALLAIQHDIFNAGGSIVLSANLLADTRINALEADIDAWLAYLPPLKEFVLPGGATAAAQLHLARAVCRRVERQWWQVWHEADKAATSENLPIKEKAFVAPIGQYLNRLADWLFVAARLQNHILGHNEILWQNPTSA